MSQAIIIGSPNSGKSLLFNRLTGLNQRVANFPGITVDIHTGQSILTESPVELIDLPGTYSLTPLSEEERVAVQQFKSAVSKEELRLVICLIDSTRLERGLYFAQQVIAEAHKNNKPVIVVANMIDTLNFHNLHLDIEGLSDALGVYVSAVSAKTKEGLERLVQQLNSLESVLPNKYGEIYANDSIDELKERAKDLTHRFGPKGDLLIRAQNKIDNVILHSIFWRSCIFRGHVFTVSIHLYLGGPIHGRN
ncbi:MAG: FeoB small GTPase domain-containing protein [Bdellovibrionales bacterium]